MRRYAEIWRLVGEDERRARDERLERCETLVVEVEVDA